MDERQELYFQGLTEDQRRLLDLIGPEAYAKLVEIYGGTMVYVQKKDSFVRAARNEDIRREFDGTNYRRLAAKYQLSEAAVRYIVSDIDRDMRIRQLDGQEGIG